MITTIRKLGAVYSWLIKQPAVFSAGVRSMTDAEKLYDAYTAANIIHIFDDYNAEFPINLVGYDPAEPPQQTPTKPAKRRVISTAP